MSDGELNKRQEELNKVRLNNTYSVTDHARASHERDKIESLLKKRKNNSNNMIINNNNSNNPDSNNGTSHQKGGNEKTSVLASNHQRMEEEMEMKDIYQGVEAYLKFLRRTKRIKRT